MGGSDKVPGVVVSSTFNKHHRLPVPERFRDIVFMDGSEKPGAFWAHEETQDLAMIAQGYRGKENVDVMPRRHRLHDGGWVKMPEELIGREEVDIDGEESELVYFFSMSEMVDEGRAYVFSEHQAWRLLPVDDLPGPSPGSDDDDFQEAVVREMPGFISPG